MKSYTQSELRKMYMKPSEELKDRIHQEISSLPVKEQEEEIVKKKLSLALSVSLLFCLHLLLWHMPQQKYIIESALTGKVKWLRKLHCRSGPNLQQLHRRKHRC